MKLFKINCQEGKMLCDKNQYNETSLVEKIKLNLYLVLCGECRTYTSRNTKLTKAINKREVQTVSLSEKELMKKRMQEQLNSSSMN